MPLHANSVLSYLHSTKEIADLRLKFKSLESTAGEDSVVIPWYVRSVSLNAGVSVEFVREVIAGIEELQIIQEDHFGEHFEIIRGEEIPLIEEEDAKIPSTLTVKNLMNLIVYMQTVEMEQASRSLVKLGDALFYIKNTVMIPDDFMPEHMMGNVEGTMTMTVDSVRKEFQFLPGRNTIFVYPEKNFQKFSRISYLYADPLIRLQPYPDKDKLLAILAGSFNALRSDWRFRDFENSRLIKNLIYQLEFRKNRELRKPLFNQEKIDQLVNLGISIEGNILSEKVKTSTLNEMRERLLKNSHDLSVEWLESQIKLF